MAHFELWQRWMEELGRRPRTVSSRIGAVSCWYKQPDRATTHAVTAFITGAA